MKKNDILLSVVVITYNQEKYIRKAIDSILMQKTDFNFEILIGNDASPDNTFNILKYYEQKYKNKIKVYNRKNNLGATLNLYQLLKDSKGEYIAFLEGDDYWLDNQKLQTQVNFLKENSKYIGVAHDVYDVNLDEKILGKHSDNIGIAKNIYNFHNGENGKLFFQINSLVCKNIFFNKKVNSKMIYEVDNLIGDRTIALLLSDLGDIYIMKNIMGCYRTYPNRYKETIFESIIKLLKFVKNLQKIKFINHRINTNYYRVSLVMDYYLLSFIQKKKFIKKEMQIINKNLDIKDIIRIFIRIFEYFFIKIKKFYISKRG